MLVYRCVRAGGDRPVDSIGRYVHPDHSTQRNVATSARLGPSPGLRSDRPTYVCPFRHSVQGVPTDWRPRCDMLSTLLWPLRPRRPSRLKDTAACARNSSPFPRLYRSTQGVLLKSRPRLRHAVCRHHYCGHLSKASVSPVTDERGSTSKLVTVAEAASPADAANKRNSSEIENKIDELLDEVRKVGGLRMRRAFTK